MIDDVMMDTPTAILSSAHPSSTIHTASGIPWVMRLADERPAYAMAQMHGIPEIIARIIAARGVTPEDAGDYLKPSLRSSLPDPSHLRDMDTGVARMVEAIEKRERIAVFGDYDVDGATSSALLVRYAREIGVAITPYIPDRMKEGYGPNIAAFDALIDSGVTLILTVDCGTLAHAQVTHANTRHCDVIVLDHHTAEAHLPEARAVINPNRLDETSTHGTLAAVGVTFLFLVALNRALRARGFFHAGLREPDLLGMLDIVALGTVADVVPLKGLNRVLVAQGLKVLATRHTTGLAALMDVARLDEKPSTYHLGYLLGPRINAGGRVGESGLGLELLATDDAITASAIAAKLDVYNQERQAIESGVLAQAVAMAEAQANQPVMLLASEGWHQGVIGIVAGRIKEQWQRPTAIIALENGIGKASARSVEGADFGAAVHSAHALGLIEAGGGHAMAAGFTVREDKIEVLHHFLNERMAGAVADYAAGRTLKLDGWIRCAGATLELIEQIEQAGPFGAGNPAPRFGVRDASIVNISVMKEKHLRLVLADAHGKGRLNAVAFNVAGTTLGEALTGRKTLHLAGTLKKNIWQGNTSVQFMIDDAAWQA